MSVRVVAYTKFVGLPNDIDREAVFYKTQDEGTDAERLTEFAGRKCYDSYGRGRSSKEYHQHIKEVGHGSVLAHSWITFEIDAVSRGLTHELVRHAIGVGISQRSTRYVDESESPWIWHPLIVKMQKEEYDHEFSDDLQDLVRYSRVVYQKIVSKLEEYLVRKGTDKATARKQARGAARGALGNALETGLVWSCNIRSFRHVLEQRASPAADAEIRLLLNDLYLAALPYFPEYLNDYEKVGCPDGIGFALQTKYRKV